MIPCPVFFEAGDELVVGAALGFQLQCGGHGALAQARIQLLALGCSHEPRWIDLMVLKGGKALKLSPLFAQEAPEARDRLVAISACNRDRSWWKRAKSWLGGLGLRCSYAEYMFPFIGPLSQKTTAQKAAATSVTAACVCD